MNHRKHRPWWRTLGRGGALALLAAVTLGSAQGSGVTPTNSWMDIYSSHSTVAGKPIPAGSYVAVMDPQGTQCGERVVTTPGHISPVMPCYGDDTGTTADEGAEQGDLLRFSVNGIMATPQPRAKNFKPVAPDTPIKWRALDVWEIDLVVPPQLLVAISHLPGETRLDWQPVEGSVAFYEVWRSTEPYFDPADEGAALLGTATPGIDPLSWTDQEGAGDPLISYAYRVRAMNSASQIVEISRAVAEFDFALYR